MIKNFLIKRGLGYAGKKLDGYKVYIASAGSIMLGCLYLIRYAFPDLTEFPEPNVETGLTYIVAGIGGAGYGHKVEKQTTAIKEQTAEIIKQTGNLPYSPKDVP